MRPSTGPPGFRRDRGGVGPLTDRIRPSTGPPGPRHADARARDNARPPMPLRDDPARGHWLKAVGHARGPLPAAWLADERWHTRLTRTGFPRRPRIVPGDRLILYASVWKRVFGVAEVTSEVRPSGHERWPFEVEMEALLVV